MSLVIYFRDPSGDYDVAVRDCYAYDGADIGADSTLKLQLTDEDGCVR